MTHAKRKTSDDKNAVNRLRPVSTKHPQLNPFLSKTFHMVNNSDPAIISWAPLGDSFLVKNVKEFSEKTLPLYFKHSKFSSFVRQLNFYGFRKLRLDSSVLKQEEELVSSSERFYHEYFQANRPELLKKIQRATTKSVDSSNLSQAENSQGEVEYLKERLNSLADEMDWKLEKLKSSLELDYQHRIANLEAAYQDLATTVMKQQLNIPSTPHNTPSVARRQNDQFSLPVNPAMLALSTGQQFNSLSQDNFHKAAPNRGFGRIDDLVTWYEK